MKFLLGILATMVLACGCHNFTQYLYQARQKLSPQEITAQTGWILNCMGPAWEGSPTATKAERSSECEKRWLVHFGSKCLEASGLLNFLPGFSEERKRGQGWHSPRRY